MNIDVEAKLWIKKFNYDLSSRSMKNPGLTCNKNTALLLASLHFLVKNFEVSGNQK